MILDVIMTYGDRLSRKDTTPLTILLKAGQDTNTQTERESYFTQEPM